MGLPLNTDPMYTHLSAGRGAGRPGAEGARSPGMRPPELAASSLGAPCCGRTALAVPRAGRSRSVRTAPGLPAPMARTKANGQGRSGCP